MVGWGVFLFGRIKKKFLIHKTTMETWSTTGYHEEDDDRKWQEDEEWFLTAFIINRNTAIAKFVVETQLYTWSCVLGT